MTTGQLPPIAPKGPVADLLKEGQSVWLDTISRHLMDSGELTELICSVGIRGITSNPTIFEKAINGSTDYDVEIARLARENHSATDIIRFLMVEDVRRACDFFRPVYDDSRFGDGYVSIEVNPLLAHDTKESVEEARKLHQMVDRPNLLVKIPGTPEGIPAIRQLISEGISINVTLLFSPDAYRQAANAYIEGLRDYVAKGHNPSRIHSVASLFISRLDTLIDRLLAEIASKSSDPAVSRKAGELAGKAGIANTQIIYESFREIFGSPLFKGLAEKGARVQRPLWASTGTKNPKYSDILYVQELIAPDTVNTVPAETLRAFADHGKAKRTIDRYMEDKSLPNPYKVLDELKALGISLEAAYNQLIREGVEAFNKSFESLRESTEKKIAAIRKN